MIPWSLNSDWATGIPLTNARQTGEYISMISDGRALLGRLLETLVVCQLRKQLSWAAPQTSLYHFRTAGGSEVSATVTASDFLALLALRSTGSRFRTGIVLYVGDHIVPFREGGVPS